MLFSVPAYVNTKDGFTHFQGLRGWVLYIALGYYSNRGDALGLTKAPSLTSFANGLESNCSYLYRDLPVSVKIAERLRGRDRRGTILFSKNTILSLCCPLDPFPTAVCSWPDKSCDMSRLTPGLEQSLLVGC
jgi:hypothetical protein